MSQITERTQKLLILVGDEGPSFESRDFKKVVEVIVNNYLMTNKQSYEKYLIQILPTVIRRIPLKQHIYAGLTASIKNSNPAFFSKLVAEVVVNLEEDLNSLKLHESINSILYLSELMNLEKLNSQCFFDIIDDIISFLDNCKNSNHRTFFILVFSRTLHNYSFALNKKVYFQFKKLMQRSKKYCYKVPEFAYLYEAHQKGTLNDGSIVSRIYEEQPLTTTQQQFQQNIKLKINVKENLFFQPVEYQFVKCDQGEKLYQEFQKSEGQILLGNIEQIIELMKQNSTFMLQKLITYATGQNEKNSFAQRFLIDVLIAKALKSKNVIVQDFIILKLVKHSRVFSTLVESSLRNYFNHADQFDLAAQIKFADLVSYLTTNWPSTNEMTQASAWDWDAFVNETENFSASKEQKGFNTKRILIKIICQKIYRLADNFKVPASLKKYFPGEDLKNPTNYKLAEQMSVKESFEEHLKKKSNSEEIIKLIESESNYQIFLEALFQKTSLSHTHLEVLFSRYERVFIKEKVQFDWILLNVIRSFWSKSIFHRIFYLQAVIDRGFVDYQSYVKYISKVETSTEEQKHLIKLELNELHSKYGEKLSA